MTSESLHRWLVPRVVAPLAERLGRPVWRTERRLRELQWRSPEELEERALSRLRALLEHAARHVPRYRDLLAGVDPRDIQELADLRRIPISTKRELRAGFPELTTARNLPASRRQPMMTSGSTGLPFEFYWDRSALPVLGGTDRFWLSWSRIAVWHTRIVIASPAYFYERIKPPRRLHALANRLVVGERTENLPADQITTARFRSLVERVTPRGPYFIRSYPGSLASLAAGLAKDDVPLASYPRAVVTLAETLTPTNATRLGEVFQCPVMNHYSAWELPQIAHSCPAAPDVLHINSERVIVRVVRPDGTDAAPGETGRVVVTDLANYVMPFINYSAEDLAAAGERCSCGRGMPTLARLEGRESEMIRTSEGREVSSGALGQLLTFVIGIIPYVWEYQAIQTAPGAVTLLVVPTSRFTADFRKSLERGVAEFLGPEMTVTVESVSAVPLEPSGKRLIIKPLPSPRP
jgi:phenylacetate-coenzyme A ligase PaaK-like adenylate-forming protein